MGKTFNFLKTFLAGYSYPVDWWSLGIVAYEMRAGSRPFVIHSQTPIDEVKEILFIPPLMPRQWGTNFCDLIRKVRTCFCVCVCDRFLMQFNFNFS